MKTFPVNISKSFHNTIEDILNYKKDNILTLKCSIFLSTKDIIEFTPKEIVKMDIIQDFYGSIADNIDITLNMGIEKYKQLVLNRQNLVVKIDIIKSNATGEDINDYHKSLKYIGIVKEFQKPSMYGPEETLNVILEQQSTEYKTIELELELIPEIVYKLRKTKFNFILNEATMEDTILFISDLLGFKKIYFIPPDNTTVYTNVVVPPLLEPSDIFDYLQDHPAYGIYDKGINYYIHDNILYIYPLVNNLNNTPKCNIYSIGEGAYGGSTNFFKLVNNDLSIITNNKVTIKTPSQSSVENNGNSFIVDTPKKHIDNSGKVISNNLFNVNREFVTNVSLADDNSGLLTKAFTQSFIKTDNINSIYSSLYNNLYMTAGIVWVFASPFLIYPHSNIKYVYEDGEHIKEFKGWVLSAQYTIAKTNSMNKDTFACKANIITGLLNYDY